MKFRHMKTITFSSNMITFYFLNKTHNIFSENNKNKYSNLINPLHFKKQSEKDFSNN